MLFLFSFYFFFFFQAEDGIRDYKVTGVQTCALPIYDRRVAVSRGLSIRLRGADDESLLSQRAREGHVEEDGHRSRSHWQTAQTNEYRRSDESLRTVAITGVRFCRARSDGARGSRSHLLAPAQRRRLGVVGRR